ncbi:hypothetical protein LCGC14_1499460 [marine sediment metagenome]|uniref:Uncharacterized protein n=1 Tax=marine sediment metagenome TaxID=412755 RepID=A0A0F9J509_9ZZZZ|nr:hypothetical protein [Candidatus Scalindua sp.]
MIKRYYYEDPLKAAIAARDFGVRFTNTEFEGEDKYSYNYLPFFDYDYDGWPECARNERITDPCMCWDVHPDSMPIFEPQAFDVVGFITDADIPVYDEMIASVEEYLEAYPHYTFQRIILRNGKMFPFYDGVEEVDDE